MRFCYFRIALLTSAFTAKAFADTAETNVVLAASRSASSAAFIRNTSASSAVTETHEPTSVDDEDRASATIVKFADLIGRSPESRDLRGLINNYLKPVLNRRKTPKAAYEELHLSGPVRYVLIKPEWIKWAYFVYQVGHQFEENNYKFMITAMSAIYDAEALYTILRTGMKRKETWRLAKNLAKESNTDVQRLFFERQPTLAIKLFHETQQQSAETIYTISRGRIFAYLEKHVRDSKLPDRQFPYLISYLSVLLNKKNAVGTALSVSHALSEDAALLGKLLSLSNFNDEECLESLVSIWVDASLPPFQIVSMLMQGKAEADHLTTLFSSGSSNSFWLHYFDMYNEIKQDTSTANSYHEQLLQMLFAVVKQESPTTVKFIAYSTILKMLVSPSTAHLSSSHEHVIKLMSILMLERTLPSDVLSMLMRGEPDAAQFKIIFVNTSSKNFWVRYLRLYNENSSDVETFARTANTDFQHLLRMLYALRLQDLSEADRYLASSTVLKILISPEISAVLANQKYLEEMLLHWFAQGVPPSDLVYMLVLEEAETDYFDILFTNERSSKLWETYTKAYYANTSPQQDHMMSTLDTVFGFAHLERILEAASTPEATSEKANSLLVQLYWWRYGADGND